MARKPAKKSKMSLIASDEKDVKVKVRPGKLHVVQVETVTPDLKKASRFGARLCGLGTNMCIAIVDVDQ